jgi:hypothetical protein
MKISQKKSPLAQTLRHRKAAGFDFTMEEVKKVASELSEEELAGVADGANYDKNCQLFWGMNTAK